MKLYSLLFISMLFLDCCCPNTSTTEEVKEDVEQQAPTSQIQRADALPNPPLKEERARVGTKKTTRIEDVVTIEEEDISVSYVPSTNKYVVRLTDAYPDKIIMCYLVEPVLDQGGYRLQADSVRPNGTKIVEWTVPFVVKKNMASYFVVTSYDKRWKVSIP